MILPENALVQVETYQDGHLAALQNNSGLVRESNHIFDGFENKVVNNLGASVSYDKPVKYVSTNTLQANFQSSNQEQEVITVNQAINVSYAFDTSQFVFNVKDYMQKFGMAAVLQYAATVEGNVALNATSAVVDNNPNSSTFGQKNHLSGPYRFYGNGSTPLGSYAQLSYLLASYRNTGSPRDNLKVFLPDTIVPQIVATGQNQFLLDRNAKDYNSWMVGNWSGVNFFTSNLLPTHEAGNVGNDATVLTLVSTNDPTGASVTQLTLSGAGTSDADAVKEGDLGEFNWSVSGLPNIFALTHYGQHVSRQKFQFRVTANEGSSSGGNVTINIFPAICWQAGNSKQNINRALQPGMQVNLLPSHATGLLVASNALFVAMPKLPIQVPYPTSNKTDSETGVSVRLTYGSIFGTGQQGFINDGMWGSFLSPDYSMRIIIPITQ